MYTSQKSVRIALAQINATVGDLTGNTNKIIAYIEQARNQQADVIVFPELSIIGYPPEDLLLKPQFIEDNLQCLNRAISASHSITAIIGFADRQQQLHNAVALIHDGSWMKTYHKIHLPNYGVFDEKRYFAPGNRLFIFEINRIKIGVNICEDIWIPDSITEAQVFQGDAEVILNISASPYHCGKVEERENLLISRAIDNRAYIGYVNLVGGQDELVFDGHSLIINAKGEILIRGKQFEEDLLLFDLDLSQSDFVRMQDHSFAKRKATFQSSYPIEYVSLSDVSTPLSPKCEMKTLQRSKLEPLSEIYHALVLGTRDYIKKNSFNAVVLGLSGGIDSALTASIAVDAVGKDAVVGVCMPSPFSSPGSLTDAKQLAQNLGIRFLVIPITETFEMYKKMLHEPFKNLAEDITEENIQARIRGNILMALSNKFGWLPLTTGNKSEVSVGYCTLYGDMAGGFAVVKDVLKTRVYQLADYVNTKDNREIIPQNTITKPPSAELRPNQKDEDSLPPYHILDPILTLYIEKDYDVHKIISTGFDEATVRKVIQLVDSSEFKRRQGPPGVKITPRSFGKDRRMPLTNRYRA